MLKNNKNLQKYYFELLNLLIECKKDHNLLKETFTKYCDLNNANIDNNLINNILNTDKNRLEYLTILYNSTNYDKNDLLETFSKKLT